MHNVVYPLPFFGGRIRELFPYAAEHLLEKLYLCPRAVVDFIWDWAEEKEESKQRAKAQRELAWALLRAIKYHKAQ